MARKDAISQYGQDTIGIAIFENNQFTDADGPVTLDIVRDSDQVMVTDDATAVNDGTGLYSHVVGYEVTATKGDYSVTWSYEVNAVPRQFTYQFTVVDPQPYWDSLDAAQKSVVENIYFKLSDGFDSTVGGPYLWELPQSHFGYETIARLTAVDGMNIINFEGPVAFMPPYGFGSLSLGGGPQIGTGWYGLVQKAGFYETLKHLARSYTEIPLPVNVQTAHLDRTMYAQKWAQIAEQEREELLRQIHMIKRKMSYGIKSRAMLVAGGIFPISYLNPARPRWPYVLTRFY